MNDGTALVVFTVLKSAVAAGRVTQSAGEIIWVFAYMSAGGALFGVLVASIFVVWIGGVFNNPMAEISGIVSVAVSFNRLGSFSTTQEVITRITVLCVLRWRTLSESFGCPRRRFAGRFPLCLWQDQDQP